MNRYLKDSGILISGNLWGQVISTLIYFVLTRIYSPDDFGVFNVFYSYIEVLIIISTCKYELSIVMAQDDKETAAIKKLSLRLNSIISVLLLIMITFMMLMGWMPGKMSQLGWISLMIPFMVFFSGTSRVYAALFNRYKKFSPIAGSSMVNASVGALLKWLFGWMKLFQIGLPLGTLLGQMASNLNYVFRLKKIPLPSATMKDALSAGKKYKNFPLFTMPKDLINSFSYNLPFLWLANYFPDHIVGLYALALTFTFRPINILNTAFEKVLYVRIMEKVRNRESIRRSILQFIFYLNVVALPVALVVFFWANPLFAFFFGDRWEGCGDFVRLLMPWVYVMLTSTSLMFIANIFSKQRQEMYFYWVLFALRILSILAGIHQNSFILAVRLFALSGALVSGSLLIWYMFHVEQYEKSIRN